MDRSNEVLMWHVALDRSGALQPIMAMSIPFCQEVIMKLLQTDKPGGVTIDLDSEHHYFFAYDNNQKRPYPSVMIFRYEVTDRGNIVRDMRQEDMCAVAYASENLLRPEN